MQEVHTDWRIYCLELAVGVTVDREASEPKSLSVVRYQTLCSSANESSSIDVNNSKLTTEALQFTVRNVELNQHVDLSRVL